MLIAERRNEENEEEANFILDEGFRQKLKLNDDLDGASIIDDSNASQEV